MVTEITMNVPATRIERQLSARWRERQCLILVLCLLIPVHSALLGWIACRCSPTSDEVAHLAAGVRIWTMDRFDLYQVNPPLVKAVAAAPVVLDAPQLNWNRFSDDPALRREWNVGQDFVYANGTRSLWYFTLARWACIPFSLVGMMYCYRWARELFGSPSGLMAAALWCFSPNILGNAALITPDVAAASLGVAAAYHFRLWLLRPGWQQVIIGGVALGLAQLTKSTWLISYGVFPMMWMIREAIRWRCELRFREVRDRGVQLLVLLSISVYFINLEYGFDGSFRPLGSYRFVSQTLGGTDESKSGNRFQDTLLGGTPVPLPQPYVEGIDLQRRDFEGGWRPMYSYLRGEQRLGGWWYYYLYGLCVKVPIGAWVIVVAAVAAPRVRRVLTGRKAWFENLLVMIPALAVFALVSSQTGFSRYFRYVLPCLPFAFIWLSRVVSPLVWRRQRWACVAGVAGLVSFIGGSLAVYPQSLAFFNTFAGGPANGHWHLLDSNVDWGQDLYQLKDWLNAHPQAHPFHLAYAGVIDPKVFRIEAAHVPEFRKGEEVELQSGWYAVSVNHVHGYDNADGPWRYFLDRQPVDRAGYSILIYRVDTGFE